MSESEAPEPGPGGIRTNVAAGIAVGVIGLVLLAWIVLGTGRSSKREVAEEGAPRAGERARPSVGAAIEGEAGVPEVPARPLEDVAQDLAGAKGVVCRVEPRVDGATARLTLDVDLDAELDELETWLAVAAVQANVLLLSDIPEAGSGTLQVEGFAPVEVSWTGARGGAGGCSPDPLVLEPAEAAVVGRVVGPTATVGLTACGQSVRPDADGDFYAAAAPGVACVVELRRHYGVWEWTDSIEVVPEQGRDRLVTVEAPPFDAVLPVVIGDGEILAVWDDDADPRVAGATVVDVDGEAVPTDADGFHLATGGDDGVPAVLQLEQGGERFVVELERRKLGFEDWLVR